MNKINTEVTLRLDTSGELMVGLTQHIPFTASNLSQRLELNPVEESVTLAMKTLLGGVHVVAYDPDATVKFNRWLKEFTAAVLEAGIAHTVRTSFSDAVASLHVVLEVESSTDQTNNSMLYGQGRLMRTQMRPAQMSRQGLDVSAFVRDPRAPIVAVASDLDPFAGINRGSLNQICLTASAMEKLVDDFKIYMDQEPQICKEIMKFWVSTGLLPVSPSVLDALENVKDHTVSELLFKYAARANSEAVTSSLHLAIRHGLAVLTRSPAEILELGDLEEEAELVVFNWMMTSTIRGIPLFDYDPRDNWESALKSYPQATAYGRRISPLLAQQEEESEVYDDSDGDVLASVLEYPHSTPAAVAVALYVLENSEGVSTPTLFEMMPTTFIRDYGDYCTALGGAGPFGRKQLNAVKDALVKRWFISYDSALAVLNKNLGELDFNNNDPHISGRLETAVAKLMHDKTLLYIIAPE